MTAAAEPVTRRRWRHPRIGFALRLLVSVALVVLMVSKAGLGNIASELAEAHVGWLVLGFGLGLVAVALQANQWRGLLAAMGLPRGYWTTLRLDTAGRAFDAALPTSIGGDVARAGLVGAPPDHRLGAALSVFLRRLMQLPGLVTVIAVGLLASWQLPYVDRVRPFALAALVAGVGLMVTLVLLVRVKAFRRIPVPAKVRRLAAEWELARKESRRLLDGDSAVHARAQSRRHRGWRNPEVTPFLRAALRGLLFWVVVVLSQWCFMFAVDAIVPLGYATVVVATVNALSMLPISLGGYGLREASFSAFLTVTGTVTTAQGAAVGACLSIQTLALGVAGGVTLLTMRRATAAPSPEHAAARPDPVGVRR